MVMSSEEAGLSGIQRPMSQEPRIETVYTIVANARACILDAMRAPMAVNTSAF
jgi:hypothetical protein